LKPAKSATEAEKKSLQARVEVFKKYQQELESILTSYTTEFFTNLKGSTSYEKKEIERLKEKGGELASEKQKLESKVKNNDSDEKASKLEKRKKELNNTADELIQNRQEELAKLDKELDGKLSALKASYKTTVEKLNNEYEKAEPQNLNQNVQNLSPRKIELPTTPVENLKKKEGQVQTNNRSI
jgi:DNA repair exonuclease SbcCD ATPase subunit